MREFEDLYREQLIDLYKNPSNSGSLKNADIHYRDSNPLCGDEIEIFATLNNGKIAEIKFIGKGCVISQAAASLLTDFAKGKPLKEITAMRREGMLELLGIEVSTTRIKCAMLALYALKKGIIERGKNAS
jgi:nitrogen fixation NifU-like protein